MSIRTLAVIVTVACCYAACWWPTQRGATGVRTRINKELPHRHYVYDATAVAPLIISTRELDADIAVKTGALGVQGPNVKRYYFWFFGYIAKLPYAPVISKMPLAPLEDGGQTLPSADYSFPSE